MIINGYKFNKIDESHVEYLKAHYQDKLTDLCEGLGLSDETVYRMIKALGIQRERHWKRSIPRNKEAEDLMRDPYLSHVKIAKKYNCTPEAVAKRRTDLGVTVRRNMCSTQLEDRIQLILEEIGLAYIPQRNLDKWSIDFYLGCNFYIDVHGSWAHSKPKIVERDKRKAKWMEDKGFKYLVIRESDIEEAKNKILDFASGFPLAVTLSKKPCELLPAGVASRRLTVKPFIMGNTVPSLINEEGVETIESTSKDGSE
jgi:G:T-mismatch repair DNA endonuclease (very short patch repair protein)